MLVKITRLDPSVPLPAYSTPGSAAFDLAAGEDIEVPPHSIRLIGTGLVMKIPEGHFLAVLARSSTPLKRGLMVANGIGVIDSDYCGPGDEIRIQVINVTDHPVRIARGERLAQGIVLAAPRVTWEEVASIDEPSRGGFGSTGT